MEKKVIHFSCQNVLPQPSDLSQSWRWQSEKLENVDVSLKPVSAEMCQPFSLFRFSDLYSHFSPFCCFFPPFSSWFPLPVCLPVYLPPNRIHWSRGEELQSNYCIHFISNLGHSDSISSLCVSVFFPVSTESPVDWKQISQSVQHIPSPIQSACLLSFPLFFCLYEHVWLMACISFCLSLYLCLSSVSLVQ